MTDQPEAPTGVIHDLGYRPYTGPRLGDAAVARSFVMIGVRNAFGLGRSGRSKVLPMILLAMIVLPALILVGVLVEAKDVLGLTAQIVPYSTYPLTTQLLISVFVAAQAPVLVSRDLRFHTITLYLARPMPRPAYVLCRLASVTLATLVLVGLPLVVLYVGGLLAELPAGRETGRFLAAMLGALLLSACLAGVATLVAATTTRRGLAVAAVIVVLVVSYTVVSTVQVVARQTDHDRVGEFAGLFSPYTLVNGVQVTFLRAPDATTTPPQGTAMGLLYLVVALAGIAACAIGLLRRYRSVA